MPLLNVVACEAQLISCSPFIRFYKEIAINHVTRNPCRRRYRYQIIQWGHPTVQLNFKLGITITSCRIYHNWQKFNRRFQITETVTKATTYIDIDFFVTSGLVTKFIKYGNTKSRLDNEEGNYSQQLKETY